MRMVHKDLDSNGSGSISLIPEYSEDLCYAYNDLIAPGDTVTAFTMVHQRDSERVIKLKLEVQVEEVEFDKDGFVLHIRGKNLTENDHLEIGASHTLEVEPNQAIELRKQVWDSLTLDTLEKDSSGELAVVLMQRGLAQVFLLALVRPSVINCCARIETSIPKENEHVFAYARDSALEKFFDEVVDAFVKHVDFSLVRCVVIASPGSTKDQFHRHLLLEAERRQLRPVMENRSRILVAHAISGHRHDLIGVLSDPDVKKFINDARAEREVKPRLNDFFNMLSGEPYLACYGPKHVELAHERMAIRKLVITFEFFKDFDLKAIIKYGGLMESVKDSGGEAFLLSSKHVPVEQLEKLNGIAALLKFPLPELQDLEM